MDILQTSVTLPLWACALILLNFFALAALLIVVLLHKPKGLHTRNEAHAILIEAEADCPEITVASPVENPNPKYVRELDAQRVYWKNAFIAWINRGLR